MEAHLAHPDIVKRLKRAVGHLSSVVAMLEEQRGCLEVAQQLQAVESAIISAKKALVHDHIDHCLERAVKAGGRTGSAALDEFKEITKYL